MGAQLWWRKAVSRVTWLTTPGGRPAALSGHLSQAKTMAAPAGARRSAASAAIPAFVNASSGSAKAAIEALERSPGFDIRLTTAAQYVVALRRVVSEGTPRVLVAGGDGTLASAAAVLAGTSTALAVLPGGTLNHFARDHGIPSDLDEALRVAEQGPVRSVDVGYLNDQLFLGTSSVGAYVRFVQTRDRLERFLGYWLASAAAGVRILRTLRNIRVTLEAEGETRVYRAPLVFIAVGERGLGPPHLGRLVGDPGGALHVVVPRGRRQARRFARAYATFSRGLEVEAKPLGLDSALVERLTLDLPMRVVKVAMDGEIRRQRTPLEYRLARGALSLVVPS
jgi:diacylglycerol kinase family enzyme